MSNENKYTYIDLLVEREDSKSVYKMKNKEIKRFLDTSGINALEGKSEQEIRDYFSGVSCGTSAPDNKSGGIITNPIQYLKNTVGKSSDEYTVEKTKSVIGIGSKTCSDLGGHENCTLTALYNIMVYYRSLGYKRIPTTQTKLYNVIKAEATELGYSYSKNKGLPVYQNDAFVKNVWKKGKSKTGGFGYSSGTGGNNYLWTSATATNLLDKNRIFMFSLASGRYYDHTVMVYGYKIYKNKRTGKKYTFLLLKDGWNSTTRYLAWTNTPEVYVACLTSVTPPDSKN